MNTLYQSLPHWKDLPVEEERALAQRVLDGDTEAAKKLVMSHLSLVQWMVAKYKGYGLCENDLMQEGAIGLMKAVKAFDPSKGVRLCSFAYIWIKNSILEYVLDNWRVIKMATTKPQKKLFFSIRKYKSGSHLTYKEACKASQELDVPIEQVYDMEQRMFGAHMPIVIDEDEEGIHADSIPCVVEEESDSFDMKLLEQLPTRQRDIIYSRYLVDEPKTLAELSEEYGVSGERIRQLEKQGIMKLRELGGIQHAC